MGRFNLTNSFNIKRFLFIGTVLGLFFVGQASSQTQAPSNAVENEKALENGKELESNTPLFSDFDEINGLVVKQTVTRLGAEFHSEFSQSLNEQYPDLRENFTIKERPTALSGSIISVFHSQSLIFRTALSPGRKKIQDKAHNAVQAVSSYIVRWQAERLLQDTFDLDHEEI
ncbi:curli production assembly/transport protein CsgE [Vibrio makurazakiensis]|uniref:CsgE family curli-type amyloid fiber assembly protein n=1 Tax=Vibrio makurazakiensis TaxID=2910250 RepID=UPI003D0D614D